MPSRWLMALMLAFTLAISMISTGVWAEVSDPENSNGSLTTAGTLDLSPSTGGSGPAGKYVVTAGGNAINGNVVFTSVAPGNSGYTEWTLTNLGTAMGTLTMGALGTPAATVTFAENSVTEPEGAVAQPHANNGGGNGDLDEFMGVTLQVGIGADQNGAEAAFSYILGSAGNYVPLSELLAVLNAETQDMEANGNDDTIVYKLSWSLAATLKGAGVDGLFGTGDDVAADRQIIESDSVEIDVTFRLDQ